MREMNGLEPVMDKRITLFTSVIKSAAAGLYCDTLFSLPAGLVHYALAFDCFFVISALNHAVCPTKSGQLLIPGPIFAVKRCSGAKGLYLVL
jgi:hypothetical protein